MSGTSFSKPFIQDFQKLAGTFEKGRHAAIELAAIEKGKWRFVTGRTLVASLCYVRRISLTGELGLVVFYESEFPFEETDLIKTFKEFVEKGESGSCCV